MILTTYTVQNQPDDRVEVSLDSLEEPKKTAWSQLSTRFKGCSRYYNLSNMAIKQ